MPRRRRGNPVAVLVAFTLIVAALLAVGWRWADSKAGSSAPVTTVSTSEPADTSSDTPVLSMRRAPGTLSRNLNLDAFQRSLEPLLAAVDETSCVAVSVDGVAVAAQNETLPVIPASALKLLVAAVAVDVLGDDHRYTTGVFGEVDAAGNVNGNLYLVGGGDPLLSTDWWVTSNILEFPVINATRLEDLAQAVVDAGVRNVPGSVVGDATRYDDEHYAPSWDSDLRVSEAGPYDALLVNDARTSLEEVADDPAIGAAQVFTELLEQRGVTVAGEPVSGRTTTDAELVSIESEPLGAVIEEMLTTSDNNTAELLLKEIGFAERNNGSREAGLDVVADRLEEWGLPTDELELADGSGLSNNNRVTCALMLGVLQRGAHDDAIGEGMAVAATSGTLADNFAGTAVAGKLRAKTGTLDNAANTTPTSNPPAVISLVGYMPYDGGGAIEFALVLNNQTISNRVEYQPIWYDLLAPALGSYPSAASVADLAPL